jgi:Flp pilus assembly protein TadB
VATRSEKRRAAITIAGAGLFIVLVVAAIVAALVILVHASVVGTALPVLVIIGLLGFIAWRMSKRR